MSLSIQLIRRGWLTRSSTGTSVFVRGQAHIGDEFLNTAALAERFLAQKTVADLDRFVSSLNGTWAVVVEKGDEVYLAVDHIRSIQLLYHVDEKGIEVFDDLVAYRKTHQVKPDERGVHEYLSSGYVYSYRTLFNDIFSLQAGERVVCRVNNAAEKPDVERKRYWRYIPNVKRPVVADDALVKRIDDCFLASIKRLLESVGEKRIVVPLSGGYDSRIIVNYLFKAGFRNVLCYTYGVKGNAESRCSHDVAERLGYDWHFVEVTPEARKNLSEDSAQVACYRYMTNGVNRYCQQEIIALRTLTAQGVIDPARDVICPGYYFDYLAGSHVTPWVKNITAASEMCEWENNFFSHGHFLQSVKAVRRVFDENGDMPAKLFYEGWAWQERLAKFIVNNVRSFEFLGFDWRLPLCDHELFDLWLSLPYGLRYGRQYFFSIFTQLAVTEIRDCPTVHGPQSRSLFRLVRRFIGIRTPYVLKYPLMRTARSKDLGEDCKPLIRLVPSVELRLTRLENVTLEAISALRVLRFELEDCLKNL